MTQYLLLNENVRWKGLNISSKKKNSIIIGSEMCQFKPLNLMHLMS